MVVLVGLAWLAVVAHQVGGTTAAPVHHHHHLTVTSSAPELMSPVAWALMCAAMMLPLALPAVRHVGVNSMPGRRVGGMLLFALGFLAPWLGFGAAALALVESAGERGLLTTPLAATLLVLATGWQLTPWKRRAVLSCSRAVPLAPYGARAVTRRLEFGTRQSLRCMAACWPLMALMVVLPHGWAGLATMLVLTTMMVAESRSRWRRHLIPWFAVPLALVTAGAVAGVAL